MILNGTTAGHAKAGEISRAKLRAIFEAVNGIDPNDNSPATVARRANAALARFQRCDISSRRWRSSAAASGRTVTAIIRDKNVIGKILRVGDQGYRRLEQPPPQPIERSAPPQPQTAAAPGGTPAMAAPAIARPSWAE